MIAKVAVSAAAYAIDKPYDYLIPARQEGQALPGVRVLVSFGTGSRRVEGLILAVVPEPLDTQLRLKPLLALLDEQPVLDEGGRKLALWMREQYFCTVYEAARAMLPSGLHFSIQERWRIADGVDREKAHVAAGRSGNDKQLLELLFAGGGVAEMGQIRAAFGERDPGPSLRRLKEKGILSFETETHREVKDKTERVATLILPPEEAMARLKGKGRTAPVQQAIVELLCGIGSAAVKEICYFTGAGTQTFRALEKKGIVTLEHREVLRSVLSIPEVAPAPPVQLNEAQAAAYTGIAALTDGGKAAAALLYGVTGSGKTQVYIKLISHVLSQGKTAIVMVPEIALTPQLLRLFASQFGKDVAVLHSSLRSGERYDEWKRARDGKARVVIGTRSAVFAPLQDLGLIVLDEEQEYAYKSEQSPRYHARDVAKYRCVQQNALLLLGSATPSVESMYQARSGVYHLFTMETRYNRHALPDVLLADMRKELRAGNGTCLSTPLRQAIGEAMAAGEQSILFLNRRGANRMVVCGVCGEAPSCPRCSVYLTYHSANHRLMCHYCGHSEQLKHACPSCGGILDFVGAGTQRVVSELEAAFPGVDILRMDADTISATQTHEKILSRFRKEKVPILVGTQMVAKGLDFENVTLVGVIAADLSLYVDDFRAAERTFSLLTQVVGRAGRGEKRGRAVIQTFTPDNDVITCAAAQEYDRFYEEEITLRRLRGFPPFRDLFTITATAQEESASLRACARLRQTLELWLTQEEYRGVEMQILGPAPAGIAKLNNRYRYKLTLNCKNTKTVRALLAHLLRCAQGDKENRGISFGADNNPLD